MFSPEFKNTRSICDPKWKQKTILRAIQVFVAFLALVITASVLDIRTSAESHLGGVFIMYLIAWGITILWTVANFIRLGIREAPIHPGVSVGIDLIAWLWYGWISLTSYLSFIRVVNLKSYCDAQGPIAADDPFSPDTSNTHNRNLCDFPRYTTYVSALGMLSFGGSLIELIHLYLFVRACIETHRRRKSGTQAIKAVPGYSANFSYGGQKA